MLWIFLASLFALWAVGLAFGVAGNLIHGLLAFALIILMIQIIQGRRATQKNVSG